MRWLKTGFLSIDKTSLFSSILFQEKASSGVGTPASEWSQASPPARTMLITPCKQADFVGGLPGFR